MVRLSGFPYKVAQSRYFGLRDIVRIVTWFDNFSVLLKLGHPDPACLSMKVMTIEIMVLCWQHGPVKSVALVPCSVMRGLTVLQLVA